MNISNRRQQYVNRLGKQAMSYEDTVKAAGHIKDKWDFELIRQQCPTRMYGIPTPQQHNPSRRLRKLAKKKAAR